MHRIYFDTNDGGYDHGYFLDWPQSKIELAAMGDELREGAVVVICMQEELEMEAVLKFDTEMGIWLGVPVKGTIRHLTGY